MNLELSIYGWFSFWATYWVFGSLLSWFSHVKKIREVSKVKEVINVLIVNMMWTFFGAIFINLLPVRAMTNSHVIIKLLLTYLITDIWFFHIHIMMHQRQIYPHLHKLHHAFQYPWALTALYCTGYEAIVLNLVAVSLGPVIFDLPSPYVQIWMCLVSLNSLITHSGIKFSFFDYGAHETHHNKFIFNYSLSPYLDMLYGTAEPIPKVEDENEDPVTLGNFKIDELKLK
jgi:sterol desaturase/sphingolipid hydroxylase (fatty acid hydroxylase superfamily)